MLLELATLFKLIHILLELPASPIKPDLQVPQVFAIVWHSIRFRLSHIGAFWHDAEFNTALTTAKVFCVMTELPELA